MMDKEHKIAILQSNYIPWKGVFDMINMVDTFVFFEDVDFTKRDWRTRNKIVTPEGPIWLTVPVVKSHRGTKIYEIEISNNEDWQSKHYKTIVSNYKRAPFFDHYIDFVDDIYLNHKWLNLSEMNIYIIKQICKLLNIDTEFVNSKDLCAQGIKDIRLIDICKKLNATAYLSGPAAKDYIDPLNFKKNNIGLSYIIYEYKEYTQVYGDFDHFVSVIDVLFNCGPKAPDFIFSGKEEFIL